MLGFFGTGGAGLRIVIDEMDAVDGERLTELDGSTDRVSALGGVVSTVERLGGSCGVCSDVIDEGGGNNICRLARGAETEGDLLPLDGLVLSTLTQSCSSLGMKGLASRFGLGTYPLPGGRTVVCAGRPSFC
jgi:hypothetical protein